MLRTMDYFRVRGVPLALAVMLCGIGLIPGCYEEPTPEDQIIGSDILDVAEGIDVMAETDACVSALAFADEQDDPLVDLDVVMKSSFTRSIGVQYTDCNGNADGNAVTFEVLDGEGICRIQTSTVYTDQEGVASSVVESIGGPGHCQIQACIDGNSDLCVVISVSVECSSVPPLKVQFETYGGMYPLLKNAKVQIFKKSDETPFSCADMDPNDLPPATIESASVSIVDGQVIFKTLPNLETELTQDYTVVGLAYEQDSDVVRAWACDDTSAHIEWGMMATVVLKLVDIVPSIIGTWEIESTFNLTSDLPPTVEISLGVVMDLATSPSDQLLMMMCDETMLGLNIGNDFCNHVFANPDNPVVDEWGEIGAFVADLIDQKEKKLREDACPDRVNPWMCSATIYNVYGDGSPFTNFRTKSTMTCTKDPEVNKENPESGVVIATGDCKEVWHTAAYRWRYFSGCDAVDFECGVNYFSMAAIPGIGAAIKADISGALIDGAYLQIDPHPVNLKYGALIHFALEKIVLPRLFGDGTDDLPAVDSYEALIGSLLAGRECLTAESCCADFEASVVAQYPDLPAGLAEDACDSLMTTMVAYLRDRINGLDSTPDNFVLGTPTDAPAPLFDTDRNMQFDTIGTSVEQCTWDADLIIGSFTHDPIGRFWGVRN